MELADIVLKIVLGRFNSQLNLNQHRLSVHQVHEDIFGRLHQFILHSHYFQEIRVIVVDTVDLVVDSYGFLFVGLEFASEEISDPKRNQLRD